jgi:alpha-beta hydrolase superfamily lysophospholipase
MDQYMKRGAIFMSSFRDYSFLSSNGKTSIHVRRCTPEGEIRGIVQIAHGIAEHVERYDGFARFLAGNGFLVVANDHLGHGRTAKDSSEYCFFGEEKGWDMVVEDMDRLRRLESAKYPNVPYFLLGHSMGSFLTRTYLIRYPDQYDAAILSGTGQQSPALINAGFFAANLLTLLRGPGADGKLLNDMAFGSYCKKIDNPRTPFDWLSTNEENVDRYIEDPLCGARFTLGSYGTLFRLIRWMDNPELYEEVWKELPILLISGRDDPCTGGEKGREDSIDRLRKAGFRELEVVTLDGMRHEILNETGKETVYQRILAFINS